MSHDLYVSMTGALARLNELDLIANNLANADTVGFKRVRGVFSSTLQERLRNADGDLAPGAAGRVSTETTTPTIDMTAGAVRQTGAPLDVAIQGEGLFEVQTPSGSRYTRAGSFSVTPDGLLATPEGYPVLGEGGPIELGAQAAEIGPGGSVLSTEGEPLGQLALVRFENPAALLLEGQNLMRAADGATPQAVDAPSFALRSVETSNVNPTAEVAGLILVQRIFEISMRTLQAEDDSTARLIQEISS